MAFIEGRWILLKETLSLMLVYFMPIFKLQNG